jgi:hypothetical protein
VSNTRALSGVALGAAALLLSGCAGSASPGVAVEVGDETISAQRVDAAAGHMCTALEDDFQSQNTVVPMSFLRSGVVRLLTLSSQARQIADEYGVEPGAAYARDVAQRERTASVFPDDVRADYVEIMSANALANDILEQVGRAKLEAEGFADPTVDQIGQAGSDVFATWPDAHGVDIDPKYGVELVDGEIVSTDTNLSVAVGELAQKGLASEPDPAYAGTLPSHQRCG